MPSRLRIGVNALYLIPGGVGGKEAVTKLLEMHSEARVIVASGYSDDPIMTNYSDYGFIAVISKPYKITELSDILSKIISESKE